MKIELNIDKSQFNQKLYPLLLDYSHRYEYYCGSAGSGKSYFITQKLIIRACSEKIKIMVCRRYATTIRNTCFALFKEVLTQWKIINYVKIRETDFYIEFPNGSSIIFIGLDEETKLLSLAGIGTIFIEEVFEVPKSIVEQLDLRLRGKTPNQQIIAAFNPISKQSYLYDYCEINPPKNFVYTHTTYKDNNFLNKEYVESIESLQTRNPQKWQIYGLGEWGVITDALIYKNWVVEEFDQDPKLQLICGLDWGYVNDETAFVASLLDEGNKTIYVFKEWYERGKTNPEIAAAIKSLGFAKSEIVCDSAEQKSIEEVRRLGLNRVKPSVKGPDSIRAGILKLQEYKLVIHPDCVNMITELQNYQWQKDKQTGQYIEKPIDAFNHLLDALRYSIQLVNKSVLRTMDKSLLGL